MSDVGNVGRVASGSRCRAARAIAQEWSGAGGQAFPLA
jgi:hypothetical protein